MNLTASILNTYKFASTDESRPGMMHIKVDPKGIVTATDGSIAVKATWEPYSETPPEGMQVPTEPVLVPVESIKTILRGSKKDDVFALYVDDSEGHLVGHKVTVSFPLVDLGNYPDVDAVLPGGKYFQEPKDSAVLHTAAYNPLYLGKIADLYKKLPHLGQPNVSIEMRGESSPCTMQWTSSGVAVDVTLMPVRAS